MKQVPWILLTVALVVIFLQNMCKPAVKDTVGRAQYNAMEKAKNDTLAMYRAVRANDSVKINEASQAAAEQFEITEVYRLSMNEKQATIYRLIAKIEGAKLEPMDSFWVKVSPHYVAGCDSLVNHIGDLNEKVDNYEEQSAELTRLMHYEIAVRDSALNNEREFNAEFQTQLNNCLTQLKSKVNAKQPIQVYAGIGIFGNRINPLGGGQVNVALRARNGQMYEVTGAAIGNTWYGGVGTKMVIRLKK